MWARGGHCADRSLLDVCSEMMLECHLDMCVLPWWQDRVQGCSSDFRDVLWDGKMNNMIVLLIFRVILCIYLSVMLYIMLLEWEIHSPVHTDVGLPPSCHQDAGEQEYDDDQQIDFGMRG